MEGTTPLKCDNESISHPDATPFSSGNNQYTIKTGKHGGLHKSSVVIYF